MTDRTIARRMKRTLAREDLNAPEHDFPNIVSKEDLAAYKLRVRQSASSEDYPRLIFLITRYREVIHGFKTGEGPSGAERVG